MKVTLIAHTTLAVSKDETGSAVAVDTPYIPQPLDFSDPSAWTQPDDELAEFAGRLCYESWDRPNPNTATNADYLANIIQQGHFSVLEHSSATFYITGVSRSLTHELVRHRHLSFSQLSQRFVSLDNTVEPIKPPALKDLPFPDNELAESFVDKAHWQSHLNYAQILNSLVDVGLTRKQAREAARAALLNCEETRILVTGNHRAWRDMLTKRLAPGADAEIQLLAKELLRQLKGLAPNIYQDFEEKE